MLFQESLCLGQEGHLVGLELRDLGFVFIYCIFLFIRNPYEGAGTEVSDVPGGKVDLWWPVHGLFLSLYSAIGK